MRYHNEYFEKVNIRIGDRIISKDSPVFIIAEAGVNHNGDIEMAKKQIDLAKKANADAVKFQSFSTKELIVENAPKPEYQIQNTDPSESQYQMLKKLELSKEDHLEIIQHCLRKRIIFLSTPYDEESINLLDELDVPAFKISSTDATNLPLLKHLALKKRPIILSTGMCDLDEVRMAVDTITSSGNNQLILLHCTSNYPAKLEDCNLKAMLTLQEEFQRLVGYSDHTIGIGASPYAVAMGAKVIEKHFTLDKGLPGPDHRASLSPEELIDFVKTIRKVEKMLGDDAKRVTENELSVKRLMQKSIYANRTIKKGEIIDRSMLICKRPGIGMPPSAIDSILGKKCYRQIQEGQPIQYSNFNE